MLNRGMACTLSFSVKHNFRRRLWRSSALPFRWRRPLQLFRITDAVVVRVPEQAQGDGAELPVGCTVMGKAVKLVDVVLVLQVGGLIKGRPVKLHRKFYFGRFKRFEGGGRVMFALRKYDIL